MQTASSRGAVRYSVSLVTQGRHRFYTFTMPSEVLARTCFVTSREEDPMQGFQRVLDKNRAKEIADYIDNGLGTIPNSIVLSAQAEAQFKVIGKGKTIEFFEHPKAFLILDGQHRVFGFSMAKTSLRVPVVVYTGLSRQDESRLFIDINTKQRPVPNELLLDIKRLAAYEKDDEAILRDVYDLFNSRNESPLMGLLTPHKKEKGKISRVTFNIAAKPLSGLIYAKQPEEIYNILANYLTAFVSLSRAAQLPNIITDPTIFRAAMLLFKDAALKVQDKYGKDYTVDNFSEVLQNLFSGGKVMALKRHGRSPIAVYEECLKAMKSNFSL